jgi:glucokinase
MPGARGREVVIAMDLGGSWVRVAVVDLAGRVVWRERRPTGSREGRDAVVRNVDAALEKGISRAAGMSVVGVGLGLAGPVDPETGIMYRPPNIPDLDGVSFKALWQGRLEWPVVTGNDATLAALGEYVYGASAGANTLVYITISTGIGAGIVIDGRPLWGAHGMAGEVGHMTIDWNGVPCKCGGAGCLEELASGSGIARMARERLAETPQSLIAKASGGDPDRATGAVVFDAAGRGDPLARDILDGVSRALGAGLVNVLHILDPDVIVLGGAVTQNWERLRPAVEEYIRGHAMPHVRRLGYRLAVSPLGDDVGLLGAAALAWRAAGRLS